MANAIAKLSISFSLVSIPVTVYAATGRHTVPLHMVHADDGGRIRQKRVCELDGTEVPFEDIARGYEAPDGRTVVLSKDDLADLPLATTREIRVLGFLDADRVDPINYDKAYFLGPSGPAGARPYALLREAMVEAGQVAVARVAISSRDSLVAISARGDVLTMVTLLWPDELRSPEGIVPATPKLRPEEVRMARTLMDMVSADFLLEEEQDEYTQALQEVVDARMAGLPAPHAPEARVLPPAQKETDLMAVLEAAVKRAQEEHPKASRARKSTAKKTSASPTKTTAAKRTGRARPPAGGRGHDHGDD
ncbi:Ku protein [Kitasatospora sp. NPDC050543]|uniref:non-homologous end joining protein Ku n=1 Tax=Kitasatospora sp. NPDC050543 TaxID=3364054 RepID=UPI003797583D